MTRVVFLILPGVELLDLAGPLQVLHEASRHFGAPYETRVCALSPEVLSDQGLSLAGLEPLVAPEPGGLVFIPGNPEFPRAQAGAEALEWLWQADRTGVRFFSICTGAFLLGQAGLLDGRACTTHWKYVARLQARFPKAKVIANQLFVTDGPVTSSAGILAGVDMTLDLLHREQGPRLATAVAREMVAYLRRDGAHSQRSVHLEYRDHLQQGIHDVQDWLAAHPCEDASLPDLARVAHMSVRNLTRQFRAAAGISIHDYATRLRLERARELMRNPALTLEAVAGEAGLGEARRLRRLWRQFFGEPPSAARRARGQAQGSSCQR